MKIIIATALTIIFLLPLLCLAEPETYIGTGEVILDGDITIRQAHKRALELAREDALSQQQQEIVAATSYYVRSHSTDNETGRKEEIYDHLSKFIETSGRGRIIDEEIIFDGIVKGTISGDTGPQSINQYRVKIKATLESSSGEPDPGFFLDMSLNDQSLKNGDTIVIRIRSTRDCYLTVFNLFAVDSFAILLPDKDIPDNFLAAGETFRLPPTDLKFRVSPSAGYDDDVQAIIAVATRDKIDFPIFTDNISGGFAVNDNALTAINKWLIGIDRSRRTRAFATYRVLR
jgi:hypothetical protein